jgi:RNA exonuclease 1
MGPPYKRALKTLMAEHLSKIIQENASGGHDSAEDARSCMELMLMKTKSDFQKKLRTGN